MKREIKFDNLRGFAMLLIVFCHFLQQNQFIDTFAYNFTYKFIYLFHLPLLVFVSGYLSKATPESGVKAFRNILIPYFIFESLWMAYLYLLQGRIPVNPFFLPEVGLWYLLSLYFWRLFLPTATRIRYVFWLSILLSLYVGVLKFTTGFLSISRTVCFFPIFLLGFYFHQYKERLTINPYLSLAILIPMLTATTLLIMPYMTSILGLKLSYHSMHMGNLKGIILRTVVLAVMMTSVILINNLMTSKKSFLTRIGRNSLSVYVLQFYAIWGFPVLLEQLGLDYIFQDIYLTTIYVVVGTIITTYLFSRDRVQELVNLLIMTVTRLIMKEDGKKQYEL